MLSHYMLPCAYKAVFGIACPLCGFQRALVSLLKGNFSDSFIMYPPLIPLLLLGVIVFIWLIKRQLFPKGLLRNYTYLVLVLIAINYAYEMISYFSTSI